MCEKQTHKGRIAAFPDGVIAIIITIMVLELKVPHGEGQGVSLTTLLSLWPVFLSYVLSFAYVGIYWNNHHHMFHAVKHVGGWVLWANLHLLFWLSLMPFATAFMGENHFAPVAVAVYAFDLMMCAVACTMLVMALLAENGPGSDFAKALGSDRKGKLSLAAYVASIPMAFVSLWVSGARLVAVALIWIVPDRRFSKA